MRPCEEVAGPMGGHEDNRSLRTGKTPGVVAQDQQHEESDRSTLQESARNVREGRISLAHAHLFGGYLQARNPTPKVTGLSQ